MDLFLIYYCVLAVINIVGLLLYLNDIIPRKLLFASIILSCITALSIIAFVFPVYHEVNTINDCIAFYSFYHSTVPIKNYSFSFLKRCDFSEEQIATFNNYTGLIEHGYPGQDGNWNKNNQQFDQLNSLNLS